jgi:hypothetical protein
MNEIIKKFKKLDRNKAKSMSIVAIAKELDINRATAKKYIEQLGIEYKKTIRIGVNDIPDHHLTNYTAAQLGEKYGCAEEVIYRIKILRGLTNKVTYYDYSVITQDLLLSDTLINISKKMGIPYQSLRMYCSTNGLEYKCTRVLNEKDVIPVATHNINLYELLIKYNRRCFEELRHDICEDMCISVEDYDTAMLSGTYESISALGFEDKYIMENTIIKIFA